VVGFVTITKLLEGIQRCSSVTTTFDIPPIAGYTGSMPIIVLILF